MKPKLWGIWEGINVPYPIAKEGCDLLTNTYCPIVKDEIIRVNATLYILKVFPSVSIITLLFLLILCEYN